MGTIQTMKEKTTPLKARKEKKAHSFYSDKPNKALVSILSLNILPLLVGIICFTAICFGSGIIAIKREEKMDRVIYFRQQNPRILPLPEQDPLMTDIGRLRNINRIFDNATYSYTDSYTERYDQIQAGHIIVDKYAEQNPLHIYVGTNVHIDTDRGSISRSVKDIYYYSHVH